MMLPTEMMAVADARREVFEREIRLAQQLALLPKEPAPWRRVTGGSMMWMGARLVDWGNGVAMRDSMSGPVNSRARPV